ncbi:MAG TPA: pitrilysin family protein [Chthoniobacterales bacterium]|nr:pitrilysin family protein [Chthoniobacterales bacterium]
MTRISFSIIAVLLASLPVVKSAPIADKVVRAKVAGIDLIAYQTGVRDVVTFRGSLPAGDSLAPKNNLAVPTLTGEMLDKGTTQHDKFAIAQKLDDIGAKIDFSVGGVMLEFSGKCLRQDLPVVISLLAEQLRSPAFTAEEFAKLKKQMIGELQRALESTDYRASQAFAETVFPVGHPNYTPPTKEFVAAIEAAKLEEVKAFHAAYYGPAQATLVAVGDVDIEALKSDLAKAFAGWTGGQARTDFAKAPAATERREKTIPMADKPNVTVIMGQADGMKYKDEDALALRVATAALGSGFTGRLMANVRDKEGLTYGIGAGISADAFADGAWQIQANFAPELLEKGMASTKRQLEAWAAEGVTPAELERVKSNLIGTFKVGLATTDGLSSALLNAVHRGYDVTWLDEYPKRIAALSLAQVNGAIKKHLQPTKMTVIQAGSMSPPKSRN